MQVFTKYYAKLVEVLPIKSLSHHFVKDEIITFDEEEDILQTTTHNEAASKVLRKIGHSLTAHLTASFDMLLSILEHHGDVSCTELVSEIKQDLPHDTIGKLIVMDSYVYRYGKLHVVILAC